MALPVSPQRVGVFSKLGKSIGKRLSPSGSKAEFSTSDIAEARGRQEDQSRVFFEKHEKAAVLHDFIDKSISSGASWSDYYTLYHYVIEIKPRKIIEFGSGVSSVILALAAQELYKNGIETHIDSMESDNKYLDNLKSIFPETLSSYVTHHYSPGVLVEFNENFMISRYENLPEGRFDMAFVDGPPANNFCCGDVFALLERGNDGLDVITDRRKATVETLNRMFPEGTVRYDYARNLGVAKSLTKSDMLIDNPRLEMRPQHEDAFRFFGIPDRPESNA